MQRYHCQFKNLLLVHARPKIVLEMEGIIFKLGSKKDPRGDLANLCTVGIDLA